MSFGFTNEILVDNVPVISNAILEAVQDFNPPPARDGPIVFGTLGTEVPSAWRSTHGGEMYKSGTSVATPIAAGIAALVLSCAALAFVDRLPSTPNPVRNLWTRDGMLSMFNEMSTSMNAKCFYLSPLDFMGP